MRDISKKLTIINTGERKEKTSGTSSAQTASYGGGGGGVAIGGGLYLPKATWDKVFEIKSTTSGEEYLFGKLPIALQYGLTMYVDGEMIELPSIYDSLPIDNVTLYWETKEDGSRVLKAKGGEGGGGVADSVAWAKVYGKPSWITDSKPKYTYTEIEGTPDLTKYALKTDIPSLSGYATESWVTKQNYATKATTLSGYGITDAYTKTNVDDLLKSYVTLDGEQTIKGKKDFTTGGLFVNGKQIKYVPLDNDKGYWKLEGDLLVTGGVTMYGSDSSFVPSTIMDAIQYDPSTLGINSSGQLYVKGSVGGATTMGSLANVGTWADSVASQDRIMYQAANSSQWIAKNLSDLAVGGVTGDYLPLSGGTISGDLFVANSYGGLVFTNTNLNSNAFLFYNGGSDWYVTNKDWGASYKIWHSGIFEPYNYLPKSGGVLQQENSDTPLHIKGNTDSAWIGYLTSTNTLLGYIGVKNDCQPYFYANNTSSKIWHSGNFTPSDYLPLSGGELSNSATGLFINRTTDGTNPHITFKSQGVAIGDIGVSPKGYPLFYNYSTSSWEQIALITNNVASATKLQTARTIWGQSFDGTGNVSGSLTNAYTISYDTTNGYLVGHRDFYFGDGTKGLVLASMGNNPITFANQGIERMRISVEGYVGIGTASPSYKLDVNGTFKCNSIVTGGDSNTSILNIARVYSDVDYIHLYVTGGTNNARPLVLQTGYGNVGIGIHNPSAKLHVAGNILATGLITMQGTSDQRLKKNIRTLSACDTLMSLGGVYQFEYIDEEINRNSEYKGTHFGLIYQNVKQTSLSKMCYERVDGYGALNYLDTSFISLLAGVGMEHETRIQKLERENKELRVEIERLKSA